MEPKVTIQQITKGSTKKAILLQVLRWKNNKQEYLLKNKRPEVEKVLSMHI